jgi:NtrC-family two-component system response regulator AlgB
MHAARHERLTPKLDREAEAALARHRWPGNVRELANVLEHALIVCRGDEIRVGDLPARFRAALPSETLRREVPSDLKLPLTNVERRHIESVLAGSPTLEKAAERLGISSTTLWRKRKRYGIEIETLLRPQSRA